MAAPLQALQGRAQRPVADAGGQFAEAFLCQRPQCGCRHHRRHLGPGNLHPHLDCANLLARFVKSCHEPRRDLAQPGGKGGVVGEDHQHVGPSEGEPAVAGEALAREPGEYRLKLQQACCRAHQGLQLGGC